MSLKETANTVLRMIETGSYEVDGQTVQIEIEQTRCLSSKGAELART